MPESNYFDPVPPTVPMDPDVWKPTPDGPYDLNRYEDEVDKFVKSRGMREGDRFQVMHPEGPRLYKYLGPDSGGRKDWMEVPKPNYNVPMSALDPDQLTS